MKRAIIEIVENIEKDLLFDSHFIVNNLIREYPDQYFAEYTDDNPEAVNLADLNICEVIDSIAKETDLLRRFQINGEPKKSYSINILGETSKCALWERV